MTIGRDEPPDLYLKPGEWFLSARPALVATLLGSCVAVTLFHPGQQVGAICHALLPEPPAEGPPPADEEAFRYVSVTVRAMLRAMEQRGLALDSLEVKLFGGADVLTVIPRATRPRTVGAENVAVARRVLAEYGIEPMSTDVRGRRGRKLYFRTQTGEVFLRRIRSITAPDEPPAPRIYKRM